MLGAEARRLEVYFYHNMSPSSVRYWSYLETRLNEAEEIRRLVCMIFFAICISMVRILFWGKMKTKSIVFFTFQMLVAPLIKKTKW